LQGGTYFYFWQCRQGTLYFSHKTTQRPTLKVFGAAFLQKGGSSGAEGKAKKAEPYSGSTFSFMILHLSLCLGYIITDWFC
jgi:hypothetical protein